MHMQQVCCCVCACVFIAPFWYMVKALLAFSCYCQLIPIQEHHTRRTYEDRSHRSVRLYREAGMRYCSSTTLMRDVVVPAAAGDVCRRTR